MNLGNLKSSTRPRLFLVRWSKMASTDASTPWHAAYPPPMNKAPGAMTRHAVLDMLKDRNHIAGKDYVLIDLRRTDHEVAITLCVLRSKHELTHSII